MLTGGWHVPAPSQTRAATLASPTHVAAAHCVPAGAGVQVPTLPVTLHDTQLPVQALLQQTPWAQKLDVQSDGCEHGWPMARVPQLPLVQTAGDAQPLAGGVHIVAHAVELAQT